MDLRRTPFHAHHVAAGGRMVPFAGFDMPVMYSGVRPEHLQVRASVGLFDVSHMGEIRVTGPRAEDALMRLLSNAIRRIGDGRAQYNAMCNPRGGVVDDVFVYRVAREDFLICVNASNRDKDYAWMVEHNPYADGAHFSDEGEAWAQVAIQGPRGVDVTAALTDVDVHSMERHAFCVGRFAGVSGCYIARTGYTGEDGFEIFIPSEDAAPVWPQILDTGAEWGIVPVGLGARDTLRLEAGNCLYGHEIDDEISPLQANLGWIVKLRKPGGFIGSDAIMGRRETDPSRIVHLKVLGKRIPRDGMSVLSAGRVVGRVTSGTRGPSADCGIAMALVERDLAAVGETLIIDVRGREAEARVIEGAFHKQPKV